MSPARWITPFVVSAAQGSLGFAIGYYVGGATTAAVTALLAIVACLVLGGTARLPSDRAFRQLILASCLMALHLGALYTLGNDGVAPLVSINTQFVLAGLGLLACAWLASRLPSAPAEVGTPVVNRQQVIDDDDPTLELDAIPAASAAGPAPRENRPSPRLRSPLVPGIVSTALFVVATLFWLGADAPREGLGGAVARELPAPASPIASAGAAEVATVAAEPVAAPGSAAIEPPVEAQPPQESTAGGSALPENAVAPSAARRECMAQIETAHLFLQFARQSATREDYARTTQTEIGRMLGSKPVGPRTLNRIADRMWEAREAEQRNPAWWATQFTRCEAARSSGSWYVVRG